MPRASLRSVFTTIADSAAFTCAGLEQHDLEPGLRQAGVQPLRQRPGLEPDPRHHQAELAEEPNQRLRLARHLGLADDPSAAIHHAHAALFQRHVRSRHNAPWLSLDDDWG